MCGCSTLAPLYVHENKCLCGFKYMEHSAEMKGILLFFSFLFLKVLPGTFKLLSGKSRSLVYNRTRCFAFLFPFLENVYLKVISLEKGRVFAATKRGGDNQSPALSEAKYYEKLFCFGHNFLFCFEILSAF